MKLQQPRNLLRFSFVVRDVVGHEPILVQPDIDKENGDKAGEIKDVLFERNWPAEGGSANPQSCSRIRKDKEAVGQKKIEAATKRHKNPNGTPECPLRNFNSFTRQKPPADHNDRNDKQQQTPSVTVRCWVRAGDLRDSRAFDRMQCNPCRDRDHGKHGHNDPCASLLAWSACRHSQKIVTETVYLFSGCPSLLL